MLIGNIATKIRWLLIMGFVLLLLMSFLSCSDSILNPRNTNKEDEGSEDENDETPDDGTGGGYGLLEIPASGGQIVFLS